MTTRLKYLEVSKRSEVALAIKTAKEFGDLSENAEYSAAKDEQVAVEIEIAKLTDLLANVSILDESAISTKIVSLGTIVTVFDKEFNEELTYKIVSSAEANIKENKISNISPIGSALLGKGKGSTVIVKTPGGVLELKILGITK